MIDFLAQHKKDAGLVSLDVPLISNLDVCDNIALIKQYHQNLSRAEAERLVLRYLQRYGMESVARKRNPALTDRERFCAMLLRAAMVVGAIITIDRPFKIVESIQDARFIYDALETIEDSFEECHIFDYTWDEYKYRMTDA